MAESKKVLYVVHCIDVEGPMNETLEATWERLRDEDGIEVPVPPTAANLAKLQKQELDLGVSAERLGWLARKYGPYNLSYLTDWAAIDRSITHAVSEDFRARHSDSVGNPYTYSWFIYDHYGFETNPRFHDDGVHHIFDHYHDLFLGDRPGPDGVFWHYHHPPVSGDAVEWNTNWHTNGVHEEILARRIIDRGWFPSTFRAGGHIERNDLSYWLEMFIPFDYSGRTPRDMPHAPFRGEPCDWRHAPVEWGAWHPDWYDYRRTGNMRRWIFRCLDLKTWLISLTEEDAHDAFRQARARGNSVLAYYNHDYRDMATDVEHGYSVLKAVEKDYPDVEWRFVDALTAARAYLGLPARPDGPRFTFDLEGTLLTIHSDRDLFGPMPFLAIKENGRYFRDNPTQEGAREWCYRFRRPDDVEAFGVAGNTAEGATGLRVHHGSLARLSPAGVI